MIRILSPAPAWHERPVAPRLKELSLQDGDVARHISLNIKCTAHVASLRTYIHKNRQT